MSQHGSMTPEEVEVGRRNLIAELRGKLDTALTSTVEVDEDTVRDLIAVLEAVPHLPVQRVDRQTLALLLADTVQTLDKDEEWFIADRILALLSPDGPQ